MNFVSIPYFRNQKETGARMCASCFWDYYWGCAGQLLTNVFFPSLVTVLEFFAKVHLAESPSRF